MKTYNSIKFLFVILIISSCTQNPAPIINKNSAVYRPNYSETYVESPDGKIARSLRGNTDVSKAQEISIINRDALGRNSSEYEYYTVKSGDSLWTISKKYGIKISQLADLNNLKKPYTLKVGQKLKLYSTPANNNSITITKTTDYIVKSGDSLSTIAEKYNMKTIELAELNNIKKPYNIRIGQRLKVMTTQSVSNNGIYIVKSGDNLSTIASNHNMTLNEIANLNNLKKPYTLKVGQKLKLGNANIVASSKQIEKKQPVKQQKQSQQKNSNTISFAWPVKGEIISSFGNKANGLYNDGINISAANGTDFKATEDGVVAYVGNELRGYGTIILIKHNNNWISAYAHCGSVKVARGDKVSKGQVIGTVGKTGNVSTPQLYFSLRSGRQAVDPIKYLK